MKRLFAMLVCGVAACLAARAAENYIPNDFDLSDGHEETISVASGDTDVYTGVFSGSGSVKKTGAGTLAFQPFITSGGDMTPTINTFSGGITVSAGAVQANHPSAFGTGAITVSAEKSQVLFSAGTVVGGKTVYTEFTNNISVTVNNTANTVIFYTNTLIRGNITGTGNFRLRHNPKTTSPGYGGPSAAIYGTVETPGTIKFNAYGTFEMHGPVKGNIVYGGESHSGDGTVELYSANNEIGTYMISHDVLSLKAANAMPGALIEWRPCFTSANTGRSKVLLNGNDQTFAGIQFTKSTESGWDKHESGKWGGVRYNTGDKTAFSSSAPATITLTGIANTTCPSFQKLRDRISLVVDAASAPGFVQEFHYHPNPTAGDIEVRAGTLSITNGATFGSVQSVTVGANGILLVTASTNTFAAATNLVVNGRLSLADDVVDPFSQLLENIEIGAGATVKLPAGATIRTQRFKQGGELMPNGSYSVGGGTILVSDDLLLEDIVEFSVPAGVTNVISRRVTGAGGIVKTGAGYLLLSNSGNDFAGGVTINNGTVLVAATNALGTGTVTIIANQTAVRQLRFIANAEISNPITQSGPSSESYPSLFFEKDVTTVLKGDFTGNSNVFFWNDRKSTSDVYPSPGPMTIFDCKVTTVTSQPIWLRTYGEFHFKKAVTALSIIGKDGTAMRWSEGGKVFLYSPENRLNRVNAYAPYIICEADEVLGGGDTGRIDMKSSDWTSGGVRFDLKGHSQTVKSITYSGTTYAKVMNGPADFHAINSSLGAPTLTLAGESSHRTAYAAINDGVSLVMNTTNFPGYAQTFSGKLSNTTGDISVVCGILKIMNGAGFPNASSVTVGSAGKIVIESTTSDVFKNVPTLTLNGELEVRSEAVTPFADASAALEIGDMAKINLPEGMDLSFKTVTTNGVPVPGGVRLDASVLPGVFTGAGGIVAMSEGATEWTAQGPGDSVWTGGNWSDPTVVERLGSGGVRASFGAGTRATASGALALAGMTFDAPGDFTVKGDGAATLSIGAGMLGIGESATARTFSIEDVAVSVTGAQEWTIPSNQTLRVKDGIVSQAGTVTIKGTGNLTLEGTNTIAGGINTVFKGTEMPLVTVSGLLATPNHEDQGRPAANDGKSLYLNHNAEIGIESRRVLCVSNAVIEKPVLFGNRMGVPSIWSPNNTTNEFRGQVRYQNYAWHKVVPNAHSEMIFSGGLEAAHSFRSFGSGTIRLTGKPCKFDVLAGLNPHTGTVIVENTGNSFLNVVVGYQNATPGPTVKFAVTGAMTNGNLIAGYGGGSLGALSALTVGSYTADLMEGTTQRCETVAFTSRGVLKGEYPAMLEVFGANPMSTAEERKHSFAGKVQGGVGFHMCGTGTLLLESAGTYDSTGDLEVSSGTLELGAGVVWNKGRKATVRGTGELKVNASGALGTRQVELFVGGDWKVNVPAGCTLRVRSLRDVATGRYYSSGSYGAAGSGADFTNLATHFTGGGQLVVSRLGSTFCVR